MLSQKLQNSITYYSSSQITSLAQNYATHTIQNSFTNLQITSVQQTFINFWSSHQYNQLVLPAHLQLSLSNTLQIPLGSKFLTDLSTFKRLHFGMLYHTIFALDHSHSSQSHSLLSLSSSQFHKQLKTHLFHSYRLHSLYLLSTRLTPWNFVLACLSFIIHSISFILDLFICSTRFNFMFVILCVGISWQEFTEFLSVSYDALKIFLISSHFPFHIFTLHFIFCLSHACCCK